MRRGSLLLTGGAGVTLVFSSIENNVPIWDRAFFFRERQFEERLDLVAKSLPVIEHINAMEKQKQIDPEMAEILRRNIFDGSNKFLQSGATIPKIEDKSEYNPRSLLSPVQKLLVAAPDEMMDESKVRETEVQDNDDTSKNESKVSSRLDIDALSPKEQELLIRLLEKGRYSQAQEDTTDNVRSEESDNFLSDDSDDRNSS